MVDANLRGIAMKTYKFQARIEPADGGGAYVFFPFDTQLEFATRSKVPVKATFDGVQFTGSLTPYGQPQHMLHVPKAIRQQIGKSIGDLIDVKLWKDESIRTLEVPEAFRALLERESVLDFFDSLSFTHRKEYVRWVTEAKTEATRERRMAKSVEMMRQKIKTPG
jgi:hypothetical protein